MIACAHHGLLIFVTDSWQVRFICVICDNGMAENDVRSKEKTISTWNAVLCDNKWKMPNRPGGKMGIWWKKTWHISLLFITTGQVLTELVQAT